MEEKRMAGNYEITNSIHIGGKEIVFGVDETAPQPYFCAYYAEMLVYGQYQDCVVGDDYVEMVELFAGRIQEQCSRLLEEREKMTVPYEPIKAEMCRPFPADEDITGKVAVISPETLRPEYRCQAEQIVLVTGGNGADGRGLGSACFCTNLYTGEKARWERYQLQGGLKPECMPEWAKEKLAEMQAGEKERTKKQKKDREVCQMEEKEIRFIDPHYKELFRIKDGEKIIITTERGERMERECHYIDDYHTKVGNYLYHICEFAEQMQRNGNTYEPKEK